MEVLDTLIVHMEVSIHLCFFIRTYVSNWIRIIFITHSVNDNKNVFVIKTLLRKRYVPFRCRRKS